MSENLTPIAAYRFRLNQWKSRFERYAYWNDRVADARLCLFIAGILLVGMAWGWAIISPLWIILPGFLFLLLLILHDRLIRLKARSQNGMAYYERGIARMEGRWMGSGPDGKEWEPPDHPYAIDLDIFGNASLFQLLCTTQTRIGGKYLAEWLCTPANPEEIIARQEAVNELRDRVDLREEIAYQGKSIQARVLPSVVQAWITAPPRWTASGDRHIAIALSCITIFSLLAMLGGLSGMPFLLSLIALTLMHLKTHKKIAVLFSAVEEPGDELAVVGKVLKRLEQESFECPWLTRIHQCFFENNRPASAAIEKLCRLLYLREAGMNQLFAPIAAVLFWNIHLAYAMEKWRLHHRESVLAWLDGVGRLEAVCALATFAYEHPEYSFPALHSDGAFLEGLDLGHPLVPVDRCVRNSIHLDKKSPLLIVSGSNMSGKSFLLRTIGVNLVLASASAPVCARSMTFSPLVLGATLQVHDAIQTGVSRFYAEIRRIRQLMDLAKGEIPLLFLLDEIMHGTNSWDRCIGSKAILQGLLQKGAVGLVTTHDLAITSLVEELAGVENVHFEDHLDEGRLVFDYKLRPGVVTKSNALDLMRAIGLISD